MKKHLSLFLIMSALISMLAVSAQASDRFFTDDELPDYYSSTSYSDVYGSSYNYAGSNVVDYQFPALEYGSFSTTQTGIMEKALLPGYQESSYTTVTTDSGYGINSSGSIINVVLPSISTGTTLFPEFSGYPAFTELTDDFLLSNGAIGRISIPAIDVKNYYIWEDTTSASMKKGLGHFTDTSVWNGNVGIAGHNRGARFVIGDIKNLDPGDIITYTTSKGTREYGVETVAIIRSDDWSYLSSTSDNRITLITCVAGDSSRRWVVQAVETD